MNHATLDTRPSLGIFQQAAIFLSGTASAALAILKPLLVGSLIDDYGYTAQQAGNIVGIEMVGVGIAALITVLAVEVLGRRPLLYIGTTIGLVGSLVPALTEAYSAIIVARFAAGFGCGIIGSVTLSVLGMTSQPDSMLGRYYTLSFLAGAAILPVGAWSLQHFSIAGGYGFLAALLSVVYGTARFFPEAVLKSGSVNEFRRPLSFTGLAWLALLASLFFWIGLGSVWAFVERMGINGGLGAARISSALTAGPLACMVGAAAAWYLNVRIGRVVPLFGAIGFTILGSILVSHSSFLLTFSIGVLLFSFGWSMFLAYMGGAMSVIDRTGRVISASVASQTIGMALGPIAGGLISTNFGYRAIGTMAVCCHGVAITLLVILFSRLSQSEAFPAKQA